MDSDFGIIHSRKFQNLIYQFQESFSNSNLNSLCIPCLQRQIHSQHLHLNSKPINQLATCNWCQKCCLNSRVMRDIRTCSSNYTLIHPGRSRAISKSNSLGSPTPNSSSTQCKFSVCSTREEPLVHPFGVEASKPCQIPIRSRASMPVTPVNSPPVNSPPCNCHRQLGSISFHNALANLECPVPVPFPGPGQTLSHCCVHNHNNALLHCNHCRQAFCSTRLGFDEFIYDSFQDSMHRCV